GPRRLTDARVRLRTVRVVGPGAALAPGARGGGLRRTRVVAELTVLDERVRDVDPEAADAAVEPEADDRLELRADVRVPPVEVRLLRREVVQVVHPALLVERPGGSAAECSAPVVGDLVDPDVELRPLAEPRVRE